MRLDDDWRSPGDIKADLRSLRSEGVQRREFVVDHRMLCDHYMHRHELINRWLDDKPELDRRLFERLPELRPG